MLSFCANALVQPPDCGMIKKESLHAYLEHIHKRIEAPDVSQFVRNHRLQLIFSKTHQRTSGQEHDRAKPSNPRRSFQPLAFAILNRAIDSQPVLQRVTDLEHTSADNGRLPAPLALQQEKSARRSQAEESHSDKPRSE